ncbi:Uma2 family endonuclease, partial [Rhizorhabdus sp.]|uniref:Uma2 family endonuclease n=1 Tax=Rhizorhabdus sp. TaxID=1968843 RepID=UPI00199D5BF0
LKRGPRDTYKTWEEGAVPSVVFEITSKTTKNEDIKTKFKVYQEIGVKEYFLFDPNEDPAQWDYSGLVTSIERRLRELNMTKSKFAAIGGPGRSTLASQSRGASSISVSKPASRHQPMRLVRCSAET